MSVTNRAIPESMSMSELLPRRAELSRRTVLRGIGTAVALPFLETFGGLSPLRSAPARRKVRMAHLYFPNGSADGSWAPKRVGDKALPQKKRYGRCQVSSIQLHQRMLPPTCSFPQVLAVGFGPGACPARLDPGGHG